MRSFRRRCLVFSKVTGRKPATSLKIGSLFFINIFVKFKIISFDILNFKNSSDEWTPLTGCFRQNQLMDLQIKTHFLLIYAKLKNNSEKVHFTVKLYVMGGSVGIMAICEWWRQNYAWSWVVEGGGGKNIAGRR